MNKLEIDFTNKEGDIFTLSWKIKDKDYAFIWMKELKKLMDAKEPLFARYTGFDLSMDSREKIIKTLNKAIEIINAEGLYHIDSKGTDHFDQEFANIIHHHFEVLYGDALDPSEIYKASSPLVQSAITKLNHCIHDLESMDRNKKDEKAFSAVVVEFLERPQYLMSEEIQKDFSMDIDFGDIVFHYGIIGKTWWEVFLDEDEEVFLSGIRPLNVMSGEFDIHFGSQRITPEIWKKFEAFLRSYDLDPKDPALALGHLCVAEINMPEGETEKSVKEKMADHSTLGAIRLYSSDKLLSSYDTRKALSTKEGFFLMKDELSVAHQRDIKLDLVPIQFIPILSEDSSVEVETLPLLHEFHDRGYIVSFMGASDEKPVTFIPSEKEGGLRIKTPLTLKRGELLHFAYDNEGGYIPVKGKGL